MMQDIVLAPNVAKTKTDMFYVITVARDRFYKILSLITNKWNCGFLFNFGPAVAGSAGLIPVHLHMLTMV